MNISTYRTQKGLTLIEILIVIAIIGVIGVMARPIYRKVMIRPTAESLMDFASSATQAFHKINAECGTSDDTANSTIAATPSVANTLAVVVNGENFVATAKRSCYGNAGVTPLIGRATGNPTDGFQVRGHTVTWSGGANKTFIGTLFTGVSTDVALILYNEHSSASGARDATTLPTAADTTDAIIRFSAPAGGTVDLTIMQP